MLVYSLKTYAVFDVKNGSMFEGTASECLRVVEMQDDWGVVPIAETGTTTNPLMRSSWKPITLATLRHHSLEANREHREMNFIRDYSADAIQLGKD